MLSKVCQADKTAWPWYSTELCTYQGSVTSTFLFTASESISTATGLANLNAYGMEIRWQASDTSTPRTTTASSTSPTSVSASPASTALSTSPTSTPTSTSTSSLSTGAKAGIGIGAALGALILLAGIIFFFIRRRRNNAAANKQKSMDTHSTPELSQQNYYVEAAAGDVQSKPPYHELSAQGRENAPVELSSESWR
ncbi:hypothetical protein EIK77_006217 [Talaromyces pinophilus]|nr:hypothetical protein EIK77_006217 [Talaromyces pinophilus]